MIFVLLYLIISFIVYARMFLFVLQQNKGFRTKKIHPEMEKVRPDEPLFTMNFNGTSGALSCDKPSDLGFTQFLANRDSDNRNHDDS